MQHDLQNFVQKLDRVTFCRVFQAGDVIEIVVIQLLEQRCEGAADI